MGSSFASKLYTYDPLSHLGINKYTDPVGNHFFGNYSTSSGPGTPGPYAGVTPTLADANAGYVRAAAGATAPPAGINNSMNNLFGTPAPGVVNPVQRPLPKPIVPGATAQQVPPGNIYG